MTEGQKGEKKGRKREREIEIEKTLGRIKGNKEV